MKEIRVYVLDSQDTNKHPSSIKDAEFIIEAEKRGRAYSLEGFESAFNADELSSWSAYIRFIETDIDS
jgi:hypothetical protein